MDQRAAAMRAELRSRVHALRDQLQQQRERLVDLIEACHSTTAGMNNGAAPRLFLRDVVSLGSVEVLVARQSIRHASGLQRLTPTEWQLLTFMLANPGVVHSRLDLACGAWGNGFAERNSEVEVYVSRLRRKLGPAGSLLETVRGRGYRLVLGPADAAAEPPEVLVVSSQDLSPTAAVS